MEHGYDPEKHRMVADSVAAEEREAKAKVLAAKPVEVELTEVPASHPVQAPKGYEQAAAERADFGMNGPGGLSAPPTWPGTQLGGLGAHAAGCKVPGSTPWGGLPSGSQPWRPAPAPESYGHALAPGGNASQANYRQAPGSSMNHMRPPGSYRQDVPFWSKGEPAFIDLAGRCSTLLRWRRSLQ